MIADASTLIIFSRINRLDLLLKIFEEIEITEGVFKEACLSGPKTPDALRIKDWMDKSKISIYPLTKPIYQVALNVRKMNPQLGIGESEAIALAQEKKEENLLLDDRLARHAAKLYRLKPFGTLRVLALAFEKGHFDEKELKGLVRLLLANRFRLSAEIIMEFWELIEQMKKDKPL